MTRAVDIHPGDSIIFGTQWCTRYQAEILRGKEVFLLPLWFENQDEFGINITCESGIFGVYKLFPSDSSLDLESKGVDSVFEVDSPEDLFKVEPMSIYDLFGEDLENFMDCNLVKGSKDSFNFYQSLAQQGEDDLVDTGELPNDLYTFLDTYPYLSYTAVAGLQQIHVHFQLKSKNLFRL